MPSVDISVGRNAARRIDLDHSDAAKGDKSIALKI
jgi:hypothetical protein